MDIPILSDAVIPAPIYGDKIDITVHLKAQQKEDLRWFVEWGEEDCPHEWIDFSSDEKLPTRNKKHCPQCWQGLNDKLAELEGK